MSGGPRIKSELGNFDRVTANGCLEAGPEELIKLRCLLIQSSKWFGIIVKHSSVPSSAQFSHQFAWKVRSVQFGVWGPCAQFSSVPARFNPSSLQLSGKSRRIVLGPLQQKSQPGVCRLGGGMVRFAGCACLLVRDVVWCQSDANSVQNRFKKSVQFSSYAA